MATVLPKSKALYFSKTFTLKNLQNPPFNSVNALQTWKKNFQTSTSDGRRSLTDSEALTVARRRQSLEGQECEKKEENSFWIRNPKTGYWMPQAHFDDVDPAELRAKLLP